MAKKRAPKVLGVSAEADLNRPAKMTVDDAKCLIDGKAIDMRYIPTARPFHVLEDDTFIATVRTHEREEFRFSEPIGKAMTIDTVGIFRVRDALGFESAIGAVFGKRSS